MIHWRSVCHTVMKNRVQMLRTHVSLDVTAYVYAPSIPRVIWEAEIGEFVETQATTSLV